jgi:hypothetical protein
MTELRLATPSEVRTRIDAIHEDIRIPHPSDKFPNGEIVVPWETIQVTDRLALLGGFRISEIVTKRNRGKGNTSDTLSLEETEHKATGEKTLLIRVNALKKKDPVTREIGIPLDPRHEPWAEPVWDTWNNNDKKNPCNLSRQQAWAANRAIFNGLGYKVKGRDDLKPGSDHLLRHIRVTELRQMQLTREERTAFFSWSAMNLGGAVVMDDYDKPEWFEWFPKLLKAR